MNGNLRDIKRNQWNSKFNADSLAYIITPQKENVIHLTLIVSVTGSMSFGVSFGLNCVSISLRNCGFKIYPEPPLSKNFPF